ncbi:MAG: TldD/PmbA family protein [Candidatus Saganbacteria bacterium]|nr:TldD/PmbA family protein [Candidatus Saganbacteria bacterium]
MLSTKQFEEILYLSLKNGGDFAEIFLEESRGTVVGCEDNKIEKISSGISSGGGIRIIDGEITYYVCSSNASYEELLNLAKEASSAIKGINKNKKFELKPLISNLSYPIQRRPNEVPLDEKTALVMQMNNIARSYGDKIRQVTVRYMDSNQAITIANSEGVYVEDNRIRTRYFINVIAQKDGILQTGYEAPGGSIGFELIEKHPPEKIARLATERALLMLDAKHAPVGKMAVVLDSEAGGTLVHEACGHGLEADFIMKGTSIYNGKIGQKVASHLVTVIDDGTITGNYGTYRFDDEGTPSQKNVLIEKGILKGFMSDLYTAKKLGLKPSGNGRRESFTSKPQPRMTNTIIAAGKLPKEAIISSIQEGLWVKRMGGGQVNVTNGDFVFEITEGYLIEDGKVKHPVRGATLIGNGPQVLMMIDMVGNDLEFQTGVCGKHDHAPVSDGQPTTRIPEITVGGR